MRTPFYAMSLRAPPAQMLRYLPPLPWPGTAELGQEILQGQFTYFQKKYPLPSIWNVSKQDRAFFTYLHNFEWMYHLREVGGSASRRLARALVASWIETFPQWDTDIWEPRLLSQRAINIIGLYEFYGASGDDGFRLALSDHLKQQYKHLEKCIRLSSTNSIESMVAIVVLGLALQDTHPRMLHAHLKQLDCILPLCLTPDGFLKNTSPLEHLNILMQLLYLRRCLHYIKQPVPANVQGILCKLSLVLRVSFIQPHYLLNTPLTPFYVSAFNMVLSKTPIKMPKNFTTTHFLRTHVGKVVVHAYERDGLVFHFSSLSVPLFYFTSTSLHKGRKQKMPVATLKPLWKDKHFIVYHTLVDQKRPSEIFHERCLYIKDDASDIRVHENILAPSKKTMRFTMFLSTQVTKVIPLEKEDSLLIVSLKMGTWVLKTNRLGVMRLIQSKNHTIHGNPYVHYAIQFDIPCVALRDFCFKWRLHLLK